MRWRFVPFYLLLIFSFWLLIFRLVDLMIVRGGHYRELSENNRIREEPVKAPRGIIYDRKGEVLVRNIPVFKKKEANGKFRVLRREEALALEAAGGTGAGELKTDLAREYPFGSLLAHILGYTGEITPEEVKEGARSGDVVGRTGVEEQYEKMEQELKEIFMERKKRELIYAKKELIFKITPAIIFLIIIIFFLAYYMPMVQV